MAHDAFISYSNKDKAVTDALCATLERRGIRCWVAPRDIRPGANWGSAIIEAIKASKVMVLVLSAHSNTSPQVMREVERAVSHGLPVLPVRIEDVAPSSDMEYFISVAHWLDALTPPLEDHLEKLAETVNWLLSRSSGKARNVASSEQQSVEVLITGRSITELGAEGICYSANDHLVMGGGTAGALKAAAGPGLQKEAARLIRERNSPLPIGTCVVTESHELAYTGCRKIFHLITLRFDPTKRRYIFPDADKERIREVEAAIGDAAECACRLAAELGLRCLAFPLIGTRVAGLSPDASAAATVRGLRRFFESNPPGAASLEKLYFSYFGSDRAKQAFERALSHPEHATWRRTTHLETTRPNKKS